MIRLETSESAPLIIQPILQSPLVYLDQCVLLDLAKDRTLADRFLNSLISKEGTLYISVVHILETGSLDTKGATYLGLEAFLQRVGPHWALLETNATEVIRREKRFALDKIPPHQDSQMLKEIFLAWDALSPPSPATAIDIVSQNPELSEKYKRLHSDHKAAVCRVFEKGRNEYRNHPQAKKNLDSKVYNWRPKHPATEFIYGSLMRETIRTNEAFRETDGPDFEHAVVSMAYSDFVVLDKKWTRRLREIGMPPTAARLYDVTEIDLLLGELESFKRN